MDAVMGQLGQGTCRLRNTEVHDTMNEALHKPVLVSAWVSWSVLLLLLVVVVMVVLSLITLCDKSGG